MSTTDRTIPAGFAPIDIPDSDAPKLDIIEAARWSAGAICTYLGVERWNSTKRGTRYAHIVHRHDDPAGKLSGIWGTAQLDAKFKAVKPDETVFIRWDGKQPHPTKVLLVRIG